MECALPPSLPPPPHTHSPKQSKSVLHCEMSHAIRITRLPAAAAAAAWSEQGGAGRGAWHPTNTPKIPCRGLLNSCQLQYIKTATRQGDKIPITQRIIVLLMRCPCTPRPFLARPQCLLLLLRLHAQPRCLHFMAAAACAAAHPKDCASIAFAFTN